MKHILFLFFSLSIYAQDTIPAAKSVIALDKMNVVYRGIANPISIAVNDAKSYKVYGNNVSKNENGNYFLSPGSGLITKVYVEITNNDDTVIIEEHEFRIKDLPNLISTINNQFSTMGYLELTLDELKNAKIQIKLIDFLFPYSSKVYEFTVKIDENKLYVNNGDVLTEEGFNFIKKANKKDIIKIIDVKWFFVGTTMSNKPSSKIKIKIIDKN